MGKKSRVASSNRRTLPTIGNSSTVPASRKDIEAGNSDDDSRPSDRPRHSSVTVPPKSEYEQQFHCAALDDPTVDDDEGPLIFDGYAVYGKESEDNVGDEEKEGGEEADAKKEVVEKDMASDSNDNGNEEGTGCAKVANNKTTLNCDDDDEAMS